MHNQRVQDRLAGMLWLSDPWNNGWDEMDLDAYDELAAKLMEASTRSEVQETIFPPIEGVVIDYRSEAIIEIVLPVCNLLGIPDEVIGLTAQEQDELADAIIKVISDPHMVIMFQLALPGETLTLSEQVNEVFGPFCGVEAADAWVARMEKVVSGDRQYLIVPVSDPSVVDELEGRNDADPSSL